MSVAPSWSVAPMKTDRPDQTESSVTVPKKSLQIETGFINENYKATYQTFKNLGFGTTLLRYGLLDNLELRISGSYQMTKQKVNDAGEDSVMQGLGPVSAGLKVFIAEEKGIRPELAILTDLTINRIAANAFSPTQNYSTIKILAHNTLNKTFGLGYNLGYANNGETPKGFFTYSIVLGIEITKRLNAYVEGFGNFDITALPRHRFDGGLTFLIRDNLQADISGGYSPEDDNVKMWFASAGLSWRIPQ